MIQRHALLLLFASILALALATKVNKCKGVKLDAPSEDDVKISNCNTPPCKLRKRTEPAIEMKIKPSKDVQGLTTRVTAEIATLPLPFVGVDGTSACGQIFSEDGKTKKGCPLKAGETYLYKNSFKVLDFYPKVKLNIHWGLVNNKTNEYISCFEVPASIQ